METMSFQKSPDLITIFECLGAEEEKIESSTSKENFLKSNKNN